MNDGKHSGCPFFETKTVALRGVKQSIARLPQASALDVYFKLSSALHEEALVGTLYIWGIVGSSRLLLGSPALSSSNAQPSLIFSVRNAMFEAYELETDAVAYIASESAPEGTFSCVAWGSEPTATGSASEALLTSILSYTTSMNALLSQISDRKLIVAGPQAGSATPASSRQWNFAFTANTPTSFDLTAAAYVALAWAMDNGIPLTVKATTLCWYNWGPATVNSISATATAISSPANQGMPFFDGERSDEIALVGAGVKRLNLLGGPVSGILAVGTAAFMTNPPP